MPVTAFSRVDEYQDVKPVHERLIRALTDLVDGHHCDHDAVGEASLLGGENRSRLFRRRPVSTARWRNGLMAGACRWSPAGPRPAPQSVPDMTG